MNRRLPMTERLSAQQNYVGQALLKLALEKKSNLILSADVTRAEELLMLAEKLGPEICVLKTHVDIIQDFSKDFIKELQKIAQYERFLIFEDRKFADIGYTVQQQYAAGLYQIAEWADMVNAHSLPGPGIIAGLAEVGFKKQRGLLLLAEMSSSGNLLNDGYAQKTVKMAEENPEFVFGFISQRKLSKDPKWLYLTPGVQLSSGGDALGQQYVSLEEALIGNETDFIIVGRGILKARDPKSEASRYRKSAWDLIT